MIVILRTDRGAYVCLDDFAAIEKLIEERGIDFVFGGIDIPGRIG